ncbi:MAG: hypothetical protein ACE37B_22640 [Ilumatobacter sp.]|uniref:hypothetical protein n=1 Tax=Ilumatobacter sp. TaxID=1967498 RepID=UPI00391D2EC9
MDDRLDDQLRALAKAASDESQARLDLDAERAAVAQGRLIGGATDHPARRSSRRAPFGIAVGIAAGTVLLAVLAGVLLLRPDDDDTLLTTEPPPATSAPGADVSATTEPPSTATPSTVTPSTVPSSTVPSSTVPSSTVTPADSDVELIAVDVASPPPQLDLAEFATIPYGEQSRPDVAIGELGVVVNLPSRSSIASIGFSGERRVIPLGGELAESGVSNLTYGPGDVVYGLHPIGPPFAFEMVAVPLSGEFAGEVVARSEPLDAATWVELPPAAFGHGTDGVIARARDVGATLIEYVDITGAPRGLDTVTPHFAQVDEQLVVSSPNFGTQWALSVNDERTPRPAITGPAVPAPSSDQRTVYATDLGPVGSDGGEVPVLAILHPDGSGSWASVPDGFEYVASDADGTVFARRGDELTLALLPSIEVNWRSLGFDGAGIAEPCLGCTGVVVGADGVPVSYDRVARTLVRHSVPPVETTLPEAYGDSAFVYHLGPDDVVYLQVAALVPDGDGLAADVVAVSLADDDAGREIGRWPGVVDNVGDSEIVATRQGLVNVNCCGMEVVRPDPAAQIAVPWLDRNGQAIESTAAMISVEVSYPTLVVNRNDLVPAATTTWTFEPGADWQPRGMPWIVPTFDGGFVASIFGGQEVTIARGWPDGTVDTIVLSGLTWPDALDPSGRILIADDGFFVRADPFDETAVGSAAYWDGRAEIDTGPTGAISLPGIDEAIDAGPTWAADPVKFANAVAGRPDVNEIRSITAVQVSEFEWNVAVTTSNLFDDSTNAVRWELVLERGDDGRFRFRSGTQTWSCVPGRGHQDFSRELCI